MVSKNAFYYCVLVLGLQKYFKTINKNEMNKLRCILKQPDTEAVLGFEKEIDFTPSKGLILYEPIVGIIGTVIYTKTGFMAQLETVLEPTDNNTEKWFRDNGWSEFEIV